MPDRLPYFKLCYYPGYGNIHNQLHRLKFLDIKPIIFISTQAEFYDQSLWLFLPIYPKFLVIYCASQAKSQLLSVNTSRFDSMIHLFSLS